MSDKARFMDFDAAVEESDNKSIEVKIAGKNYEFPPELPAKVVLSQLRFMDDTGQLSAAQIPDWLATIVGKDNLDEMLENGASWEQLQALLNYLLKEYGIAANVEAVDETAEIGDDEEAPK
jgi:hypothetical protein|tara:strand:+ start:254 stop:616 length:363 start_codon:yes stop_codon:yes gene_type:complete